MIMEMLYIAVMRFLYSVPILVVAIFSAHLISTFISRERVESFLRKTERNILGASLIGLVTPGPLAPYLPLLRVLKKRGLSLSVVAAFITSQTLVGPMRAFLEVDFFGVPFFALRVVISFLTALGVGAFYHAFGNHIGLDVSATSKEEEDK